MIRDEMRDAYFNWMCAVTNNDRFKQGRSYECLMRYLDSVSFRYSIPLDGNRAEDGVELRYRYGDIVGINRHAVALYLDDRDCSVLEMMAALSIRCEEHIMKDHDLGDRTGYWFWGMIQSLGLLEMSDDHFNEEYVVNVIHRFLDREYGYSGEGGLFTVNNPPRDMRNIEIWYQMCAFLNELV